MNHLCSLCHTKFSLLRSLKRHMIKVHKISLETKSCDENAKHYNCLDCNISYGINQDFILHLESTHDILIEREELTFQSYADFDKWKQQVEKLESCKYIRLNVKTNDAIETSVKYECSKTGKNNLITDCISNIKTVKDSNGNLFVTRIKTHYGHEVKKANSRDSDDKTSVSNVTIESVNMNDDSEDNLFEHNQNINLKEEIKIKCDAILSRLDKFDNKKLEKLNMVLNNICEELDLLNKSTNNDIIGTIIISSNSSLDHSYI